MSSRSAWASAGSSMRRVSSDIALTRSARSSEAMLETRRTSSLRLIKPASDACISSGRWRTMFAASDGSALASTSRISHGSHAARSSATCAGCAWAQKARRPLTSPSESACFRSKTGYSVLMVRLPVAGPWDAGRRRTGGLRRTAEPRHQLTDTAVHRTRLTIMRLAGLCRRLARQRTVACIL